MLFLRLCRRALAGPSAPLLGRLARPPRPRAFPPMSPLIPFMYTNNELKERLLSDLKEIAEKLNVGNFKRLSKQDLIYKILDQQALTPGAAEAPAAPVAAASAPARPAVARPAAATAAEESPAPAIARPARAAATPPPGP